jgi:hypothetical protein
MAGKGGSRKHPEGCICGNCPKMGRPKKPRLTDHTVAERILAKIKAEEEWVALFAKAKASRSTTEAVAILRYLEDRVYGKPVAPIEHKGDKENPIPVDVTVSNGTQRLLDLLGKAARRSVGSPKS